MSFEFELDLTDADNNEISIIMSNPIISKKDGKLSIQNSLNEFNSENAELMFSEIFENIEDIKEILCEEDIKLNEIVLNLKKNVSSSNFLKRLQSYWNDLNLITFEAEGFITFTGDDPFAVIALVECVIQDFALECFGLDLEMFCQELTESRRKLSQKLYMDFDLINKELKQFFK